MNKNIGYTVTEKAITVTIDGLSTIVPKTSLNYQAVKKALHSGNTNDIQQALNSDGFVGALTEGKAEFDNGVLKYKGHEVAPTIAEKLTIILNEGIPALPWLKFVDRLLANPSKRCLDNLYMFLEHKGMPISQTGTCLGYKGVNDDLYSCHGNSNTIVLQGQVNDHHQIYNGVGETIEVDRISVDDDPSNGCSAGLHIGSFDYADNWAGSDGKLLLVEFDPANAVSVPSDCDYQKLRVTKYTVLKEITSNRKLLDRPVYNINDDEDDNTELHPMSNLELLAAADKIAEFNRVLEVPIGLKGVAEDYDVSMHDLVNALIANGFEITWDDMSNPTANKVDNN